MPNIVITGASHYRNIKKTWCQRMLLRVISKLRIKGGVGIIPRESGRDVLDERSGMKNDMIGETQTVQSRWKVLYGQNKIKLNILEDHP